MNSRRIPCLLCGVVALSLSLVGRAVPATTSDTKESAASARRDGQHDFDFEIGTWKTKVSRLQHPLSGSTAWVDYEGTTVVRPIMGGRANLAELDIAGKAGAVQGVSLRLYNPLTHEWSLNYASLRDGALGPPPVGGFVQGRGEFIGHDTLEGRPILVRFVIVCATSSTCRFEQAFSADGGKAWEVNWVATDTRIEGGT